MVKIIPGILEQDFSVIQQKVSLVKPYVDMVHLDIMDGDFVPQTTFRDPAQIATLDIRLGVHLMVAHPEFSVKKWATLANVDRVFVHEEAVTNLDEVVKQVRSEGKKVGLSINPETSVIGVKEHIHMVDMIMIMGVEPGQSGQEMLPDTFEKVREAKKYFEKVLVVVDGGVTMANKKRLVASGADELVANSAIFDALDIKAAIEALAA